eukprot:Blabericola_migrator_1__1816@NODE_1492_length_4427_cov_71_271789_g979_i0_p3_GENE_NODE_1492_length_4427_cov_71_271789_g979_i0NODE_1492_length_4427_cov_71_271789_g979_i0_p3_ORF_typecomplete_len154_score20_02DCP1/PF06058_13/6_3e08_NODE_1492_length_4427_cov_71_271789_g979_i038934354
MLGACLLLSAQGPKVALPVHATSAKSFAHIFFHRYRLIVLNQKHQQNLVENIDASWELTEEPHYIFYRRDDPDVYRGTVTRGLWFHDDAEGHRIRGHLKKMIAEMKELAAAEKRTATKGGSAAESSSANGGDSGDELTESMVAELLRSIIASK